MSKAMFGFAAALGLAISPAWAGDDGSDEKAVTPTVAKTESDDMSTSTSANERASKSTVDSVGRGSATMEEGNEVSASHEARWLREREGYRDGGY